MYIIKQVPEDFKVEELMELEISEAGDYAYFLLEKKNWTTLKALQKIARQLKISAKRLHNAGMKDRRAVTFQHISAYGIRKKALKDIKLKDIKIRFIGYGKRQIGLGKLKGNRFTVVVRNLDRPQVLPAEAVIPNYFDDQRFGGYRPNMHIVGKLILKNEFERAVKTYLCYPFPDETDDYRAARHYYEDNWGRWQSCLKHTPRPFVHERQVLQYLVKHPDDFKGALKNLPRQLATMFTYSLQAKLWNEMVSIYLKKYVGRYTRYTAGKLFFPDNPDFEDTQLQMIGYDSSFTGKFKVIADRILKREGLSYKDFHVRLSPMFSAKAVKRNMLIKTKIRYSVGNDELNQGKKKQTLSFYLPKGSFATIIIRRFFH